MSSFGPAKDGELTAIPIQQQQHLPYSGVSLLLTYSYNLSILPGPLGLVEMQHTKLGQPQSMKLAGPCQQRAGEATQAVEEETVDDDAGVEGEKIGRAYQARRDSAIRPPLADNGTSKNQGAKREMDSHDANRLGDAISPAEIKNMRQYTCHAGQ